MDSELAQHQDDTQGFDKQTTQGCGDLPATQGFDIQQSTQGFDIQQSTQGFEPSSPSTDLVMDLDENNTSDKLSSSTHSLPSISVEPLIISEPIKLISLSKGHFTCTACSFIAISKNVFKKHLDKHTLSNAFMCMHCATVSMNISDICMSVTQVPCL